MNRRLANRVFDYINEIQGVVLCGCDEHGKRIGFYRITAKTRSTDDLMSIVDYTSDLDDVYIQKIDTEANEICILVDCRTRKERSESNVELADIFSGAHS